MHFTKLAILPCYSHIFFNSVPLLLIKPFNTDLIIITNECKLVTTWQLYNVCTTENKLLNYQTKNVMAK